MAVNQHNELTNLSNYAFLQQRVPGIASPTLHVSSTFENPKRRSDRNVEIWKMLGLNKITNVMLSILGVHVVAML